MVWRVTNEVIVVREHGPSFELPAEVASHGEQTAMQNCQAICTAKVMCLQVSAGGDEVRAALGELMQRGVRPRSPRCWHAWRVARFFDVARIQKAAQQRRTLPRPRDWRVHQGASSFRQVLDCAGAPALFGGGVVTVQTAIMGAIVGCHFL